MSPSSLLEYIRIRRQSGESLAEIAHDFGVSHQQVFRWMDGSRNPSRMACRVAELLVREQIGRGLGTDWPLFE